MADDRQEPKPTQSIPAKDGDLEVDIPSRDEFVKLVERVAPPALRKRPAETDEPPERSE
jgi:hypothetical protein